MVFAVAHSFDFPRDLVKHIAHYHQANTASNLIDQVETMLAMLLLEPLVYLPGRCLRLFSFAFLLPLT
jgi:hypothetical protein